MRRALGVVFLIIAVVLTIAIPGQLPAIIKCIFGMVRIFTGQATAHDAGFAIGAFAYWVFHAFVAFIFWKYGLRWVKKTVTANEDAAKFGDFQ